MNRAKTVRLTLLVAASAVIAILLSVIYMAVCPLPRHTVGLDAVLAKELGKQRDGLANYRCTLGAHRGDSLVHVENTRGAIVSARYAPKYAFIECDVQYSSDNRVIAFHDKRLRRVFGHRDKVGASTYAELRDLTGGEIATYEEVMDAASGKRINIEVKSQGDDAEDQHLVDFIVADIKARKMQKRVLVSSISEDVVTYTSGRYPEIATGQIFWIKASTYLHLDFLTRGLFRKLEESQADYLMLHVANLRNIGDLLRLKPTGKTIVFWDFDDTMYVIHKDLSDRLWGDSYLKTLLAQCRYRIRRSLSTDNGSRSL